MERMSIKAYAAKHKLSMFNVVKMVKSGELKSETVEENGKEVTYIVASERPVSQKGGDQERDGATLEAKVAQLERDVSILKRELDALKMSMGIKA